jgi:hypothetical protein
MEGMKDNYMALTASGVNWIHATSVIRAGVRLWWAKPPHRLQICGVNFGKPPPMGGCFPTLFAKSQGVRELQVLSGGHPKFAHGLISLFQQI